MQPGSSTQLDAGNGSICRDQVLKHLDPADKGLDLTFTARACFIGCDTHQLSVNCALSNVKSGDCVERNIVTSRETVLKRGCTPGVALMFTICRSSDQERRPSWSCEVWPHGHVHDRGEHGVRTKR